MVFAATFTSTDIWLAAVAVVLLALTVFLAMSETALDRMTVSRARAIEQSGGWGSSRIVSLVAHPEEYLNVVLFVMLVCQLIEATLVGVLAYRVLSTAWVIVVVAINIFVVFVVAEALPKTYAIENTEKVARIVAPVIRPLARFWPLRMLARGLIGITNVVIPGKGLKSGPFVSEGELLALADQAVSSDVLEEEERELIEQVIEFGDTICREVMVPRPDMLAVSDSLSVSEVLELALADGRSRVPVYGEGIDDITGVAYMKDLVRASRAGRENDRVKRFSRKPFFVPETKRISDLLSEMKSRSHLAIAIDEYGGTAGLVTLEDVLEELVGEIVDEYDQEDDLVEHLPEGRIRVKARLSIDEVNEILGVELPEGDWDTIGGLMFHLFGHVPFEGESVMSDGFKFRAGRVEGRRIGVVTIERMDT